MLVKDSDPGVFGASINELVVYDGRLWFDAYVNNGQELWVSDGTAGGTYEFKNINPGNSSASPDQFTTAGGLLYFVADDGVAHGEEVWVTDGTVTNTVLLKDINTAAAMPTPTT